MKYASLPDGTLGLESAVPDYQTAVMLVSGMDSKFPRNY